VSRSSSKTCERSRTGLACHHRRASRLPRTSNPSRSHITGRIIARWEASSTSQFGRTRTSSQRCLQPRTVHSHNAPCNRRIFHSALCHNDPIPYCPSVHETSSHSPLGVNSRVSASRTRYRSDCPRVCIDIPAVPLRNPRTAATD
jgi:hypothetical protein